MLLAPDSSPPPRNTQRETSLNYTLISNCFALAAFSLFVGIGLATGRVPLERAYLLMSIGPFLLSLWQFYGYATARGARDLGLFLGALGWLLVGLSLLSQNGFLASALLAGTPPEQIGTAPLSRLLAILGIALVASGAFLSLAFWRNLNRNL